MMKALVTGGAGFIGSNLVAAIFDKYEVTVLDNFHTGSMSNLDLIRKDIKVIKGSANDCLALNLSPDVIYHLGIPSSSPMYIMRSWGRTGSRSIKKTRSEIM
jgi:UDP-glucose 4-epimerase